MLHTKFFAKGYNTKTQRKAITGLVHLHFKYYVKFEDNLFNTWGSIALTRILETVVTFHFSGGKVYSMTKGCHTCMIKHTKHVQSLHCSTYLTWLDVCIYEPRSHFHFLKNAWKRAT